MLYFLSTLTFLLINILYIEISIWSLNKTQFRGWGWCEGEEGLWTPILLKSLSLGLALVLVFTCVLVSKYKAAFTLGLVCVYLKYRDLSINALDKLRRLECTVSRYAEF